jgi:hypothetical protein
MITLRNNLQENEQSQMAVATDSGSPIELE